MRKLFKGGNYMRKYGKCNVSKVKRSKELTFVIYTVLANHSLESFSELFAWQFPRLLTLFNEFICLCAVRWLYSMLRSKWIKSLKNIVTATLVWNAITKTYLISHHATRTLHFWLKNDSEKWSKIFHFEIQQAPLEIPANLPGQFCLSGQIFLATWVLVGAV